MGTGYTRNDTTNNIADGNVINAADLDGEFDAIVTALGTGGHTHDGTAAEGGPVTVVGPAQDVVVSASIVSPKTDNTLDIGTSTLEFKDLYLDGTAHIDTLDVDENANIDGNLAVGGNLTVTGTTAFNGGTITLGDAAADNVVFGADVDSNIIPDDDDTYDLGSSTQQWRNLFIDGIANIDTASIDNISDDTLVATNKKVQFRDTAISVSSSADATLDIVSDGAINLTAGTDVVIPANVGVTFGTGEKIEGDSTDLTITSGAKINLTATSDIHVPNDVGIIFGGNSEKIEGDGTDLTISGAKINLAATTDVHLANDIGIVFGDAGEKIEGDGTNLAINSSGDVNITATTVDLDGDLEVSGTLTQTGVATFTATPIFSSDVTITDDLNLVSDGAVITFGANNDVTITHDPDDGLFFKSIATGASNPFLLTIQTGEVDIAADDIIGKIQFQAPDESTGSDAILIGAAIQARATAAYDADQVETALDFMTGQTANATIRMTVDHDLITMGENVDLNGDLDVSGTGLVTGVLTTTAGITSGSDIVSDTDSTDDLGTTSVRWANLFVDAITATDQITATGFTGTLDGALGSGAAATAVVTTLAATTLDTSGVVNLNLATDSTSSTSGALIVDGGVGIAKKLFVGTALDVSTTLVVDGASTLTGAVLKGATATEHGAGAVATSFAPVTRRSTSNGVITTKIHFDLTGLGGKGGTANDVIGLPAGGNAFIGRNVVGTNGVIYRAELACIELAAAASGSATVDIDVATNTSGTIAYDGAGGTAKLFNTGGMVAGQELSNITPAITANDFFYLVEGDTAATDGVYSGGQFVLTLYGHAVA